jgi:hypothetical protein
MVTMADAARLVVFGDMCQFRSVICIHDPTETGGQVSTMQLLALNGHLRTINDI